MSSLPVSNCIDCFSHSSDEISQRSSLLEEGVILAHGSRGSRVPGGGILGDQKLGSRSV